MSVSQVYTSQLELNHRRVKQLDVRASLHVKELADGDLSHFEILFTLMMPY